MPEFKYLQYKLPVHFIEIMDEYIARVNESSTRPLRYKRSFLFSEAIEYYIKHDLALKIK